MRILYMDHFPDMGGGQKSLVTVLSNLDRAKVEPYVLCDLSDGSFTKELDRLRIPVFKHRFNKHDIRTNRLKEGKIYRKPLYLLESLPACAKSIWEIKRILRDNKIDIIYANTTKAAAIGCSVSRLTGIPLIYRAHNSRTYSNHGWIDSIICGSASKIIANSAFTARSFEPWAEKTVINYPIVDFSELENSKIEKDDIRQEYGIDSNAFVITQIAMLIPLKRHKDLVYSLRSVVERSSRKVMLLFVGSDSKGCEQIVKAELEDIIEELRLSGHVIFTGYREDIGNVLEGSDLLVVPSEVETFGIVLVEALHFGVPVVASNCGAIPEIVKHNETGYLFETKNIDDLTSCIMKVINDYDTAKRLAKRGREYIREKLSADGILAKEYGIYAEVLMGANN